MRLVQPQMTPKPTQKPMRRSSHHYYQGLVDEIVLIVYPVLLGRGKRVFSDSAAPREFALVSTKATSSGLLLNIYRQVGLLRTE